MKQYSKEFKAGIITKMLPPNNVSISDLARDTGVPKDTLYGWRIKLQKSTGNAPVKLASSGSLNSEEKFAVVIETASLNDVELSEYCRRKGLYSEQINAWRNMCQHANASSSVKVDRDQLRHKTKEIKRLEAELWRKEKALAETAALLVLKKKVSTLWEAPKAEKSTLRSGEK